MLAQLPTLGKDEYREGLMWDPECLEHGHGVAHDGNHGARDLEAPDPG